MKKHTLWLAILLLMCFALQGCVAAWDPVLRYSGEFTDLAATAIYSIPGVESSLDDQYLIVEQDEYGRTLFLAYLPNGILIKDSFENGVLALAVMQDSDDAYVRFYGEQNYIPVITDSTVYLDKKAVEQYYSVEEVTELKLRNDWGCPKDTVSDQLVEVPIGLEKELQLTSNMDAALRERVGSNYRYQFLRQDVNGNQILFGLCISESTSDYGWFLAAFDREGELIEDSLKTLNSQDLSQIAAVVQTVKEMVGWDDVS